MKQTHIHLHSCSYLKTLAHLLERQLRFCNASLFCFVFVAKPVAHYEGDTDFMTAKQMPEHTLLRAAEPYFHYRNKRRT